jgi:hypothetical protein
VRIVEAMTQSPPRCLYCGRGNTPDNYGNVPPALDLERDVGWGDPTYLCQACCERIALLWGWISPEAAKELDDKVQASVAELHETRAQMDAQTRRLNAIVKGRKALNEERRARRSTA